MAGIAAAVLPLLRNLDVDDGINIGMTLLSAATSICELCCEEGSESKRALGFAGLAAPGVDTARFIVKDQRVKKEEAKSCLQKSRKELRQKKQDVEDLRAAMDTRQLAQNIGNFFASVTAFRQACARDDAIQETHSHVQTIQRDMERSRQLRRGAARAFNTACADATSLLSSGKTEAEMLEEFERIHDEVLEHFKAFDKFSAVTIEKIRSATSDAKRDRQASQDAMWQNAARVVQVSADLALTVATRGSKPLTSVGKIGVGLGVASASVSTGAILIEWGNIEQCDRILSDLDTLQKMLEDDNAEVQSFLGGVRKKASEGRVRAQEAQLEMMRAKIREEVMAELALTKALGS